MNNQDLVSLLITLAIFGTSLLLFLALVFIILRFLIRQIIKLFKGKRRKSQPSETSIDAYTTPHRDDDGLISALNMKCRELSSENEKLKLELDKSRNRIESLEEKLKRKQKNDSEALLKSKIEDLEKEIKQKEEVIEKIKSEINKKDNKIRTLENELIERNSEINQLEDRAKKLEVENNKYRIVQETLSSILRAKYLEDPKKLEKIKRLENFILEEFIPTLDLLDIFPDEYKRFRYLEELVDQFKLTLLHGWNRDNLTISLIGKFSSGKSSILNSLIGEELLVTHVNPTTAIPTLITDGLGYRDTVYFVDSMHNLREIEIEKFKNITYLTVENIPLSYFIKYFLVSTRYKDLSDINFIDTPGFSSDKKEDFLKSKHSIDMSDIVFFIVDINDGTVGRDSLEFLSQIDKDIYLILNKADTKSPREANHVREHILKTCESLSNIRDVFLYSAKKDKDGKFKERLIEVFKGYDGSIKKSASIFDIADSMCNEILEILKGEYLKSNTDYREIERKIETVNNLRKKLKNMKWEVEV